jgi:hypothetical protein
LSEEKPASNGEAMGIEMKEEEKPAAKSFELRTNNTSGEWQSKNYR